MKNLLNWTEVVILTDPIAIFKGLDDAKPPRHYDMLGHYQIIIFIKVVSDAAP